MLFTGSGSAFRGVLQPLAAFPAGTAFYGSFAY